ncbi:transglycosylase SLT domain-containing protein [Streptomyces sp. 6N223]|uniref:transglycosylase SLT domain-containing protein n=1 Tax=Streptomyces sp. 6N223 TaxID=3457412 RepID=UPI003FD1872E
MSARRSLAHIRSPRSRITATAALASAGVAAIALSVLPVQADAESSATTGGSAAWDVKAADIPGQRQPAGEDGGSRVSLETGPDGVRAVVGQQDRQGGQSGQSGQNGGAQAGEQGRAGTQAQDQSRENAGKREARRAEERAQAAEREQAQEQERQRQQAREQRQEQQRQPVSRGAAGQPRHAAEQAATQDYPYTLDGWIRESLAIMAEHGIPGTYDGLYRNIMRESSGDPNAINLWDINAQNGTPSIGLLQVIQPTFDAYHVAGTSFDIYNPVSNIVAAAHYAQHRYGSIDNVFGPY